MCKCPKGMKFELSLEEAISIAENSSKDLAALKAAHDRLNAETDGRQGLGVPSARSKPSNETRPSTSSTPNTSAAASPASS
jgi:hypothetical protein